MPLIHIKGYAAPETKVAVERARLSIEQADALGEPPEDPLLLFSVLYGFWVANYVAFNGDVMLDLAAEFLVLAEKQGATVPLMIGHRLVGMSLLNTGDPAGGRRHLDRAINLYDPAEHRPLATQFGQDVRVAVLSFRSLGLWVLGYPDAALADVEQAFRDARDIGQAPTLMYALTITSLTLMHCGTVATASKRLDELAALADEKDALFWTAIGKTNQGCARILSGNASEGIEMITSWLTVFRSTGSSLFTPWYLSNLAKAYAEIDQFDDACRCIGEAMTAVEASKERWCEAEVHRMAGEIALRLSQPDVSKAEEHFARALAIARQQQAKSWELRAATSMARVWRDHGKQNEACDLLAPVFGWFTEGFNTPDLAQAKALLDTLSP
jgi:predicted ATPase